MTERTVHKMTSDQSFIRGAVSLLVGATLGTVAGWIAGASLWIAVAVLVAGASLGIYGMVMLWRSWHPKVSPASNRTANQIFWGQ